MRARVMLFAEPRSSMSVLLVSAALRAAHERGDIEITAVCDGSRRPAWTRALVGREIAAAIAKRLFDELHPIVLHPPMLRTLRGAARKAGVPLVVPPERNVNHPDFVDALTHRSRADFALSLGCLQVFRSELLGAFRAAVNYHNGLLPAYRGLRATAWSVYRGEDRTGFTFHHMSEKIDQGAILHQDDVAIVASKSVAQLEWEKSILAAQVMDRIFDSLVREDPGRPQTGPGCYFAQRDVVRVRKVGDPSAVSWEDLERRIRAFDFIELTLGGSSYEVTKLRRLGPDARGTRLAFLSLDGVNGEPIRFMHLPLRLYQARELVGAASAGRRSRAL